MRITGFLWVGTTWLVALARAPSVEQQPNCCGWEKVLNLRAGRWGLSGLSRVPRYEIILVFDEQQTSPILNILCHCPGVLCAGTICMCIVKQSVWYFVSERKMHFFSWTGKWGWYFLVWPTGTCHLLTTRAKHSAKYLIYILVSPHSQWPSEWGTVVSPSYRWVN